MSGLRVEYGKAVLFQLDSAEFGTLDVNLLGIGEELVDVSNRVVSLSVRRGRQDALEPVRSGQASVTLRNLDGALDPLNTGSPLFPGVEPARTLNIYGGNYLVGPWSGLTGTWEDIPDGTTWQPIQVFAGLVEDIALDFTPGGDATVQLSASDNLSILALAEFPPAGYAVGEEDSGDRVQEVLDSDSRYWRAGRDISVGDSILAAGTADGNVLQYLNTVALSEGGTLFVGRDGDLVFRNRLFAVTAPLVVLSDNGTNIGYETLVRQTSGESLRTVAFAERAGTRIERENALGLQRFGFRALDLGNLLLRTDTDVEDRLDFELALRAEPKPTVREVQVSQLRQISTSVLNLELGDPVLVIFTPPNVQTITESGVILNVRHDFTVGAGWRTTFGMQPSEFEGFFVIGTSTLDGDDVLAF